MQKPNFKNKQHVRKQAFTLIELLIVIAIIGILFIVLVSKVDFATDKAKATGVQTDFRSFQMAFDTVAKENAGFNTFGWDTGDANQNGKRDSYDEGDNGAGGGTAKNGIQDGTEVFTGHKVYAETFTKVFSLKKNGAGSYDREALNRLETAINANLDPKLHITIKDDGEIVMANGAQDPWNKEYHGWYITNAEVDKKDRGAIVMYSDGANNEFGSEHKISNGIVSISIPGNNKHGKDDYAICSVYTYINGYGEVLNVTAGFSNNQTILGDNGNGSNDDSNIPDDPDLNDSKILYNTKYYGKIHFEDDSYYSVEFFENNTLKYTNMATNEVYECAFKLYTCREYCQENLDTFSQSEKDSWAQSLGFDSDYTDEDLIVWMCESYENPQITPDAYAIFEINGFGVPVPFLYIDNQKELYINAFNGNGDINLFSCEIDCVETTDYYYLSNPNKTTYFACIKDDKASFEKVCSDINGIPVELYGTYAYSTINTISLPKNIIIGYHAFFRCNNLNTIIYDGTMAEWNGLVKGEKWNYGTQLQRIECSDGIIDVQ